MPKSADTVEAKGALARLGMTARRWAASFVAPASEIKESDAFLYGASATTVATLMGAGDRAARARETIYEKWSEIESSPLGGVALSMLTTAALGGHESNGDLVFIEKTPKAKKDKRLERMVEEISEDVGHLLNREAFGVAYMGAAYGDAYSRIYTDARGVVDLYTGELVRPQIVQPFERGNRTVGYVVYIGERNFTRLDVTQMARLKMPRTQWVPQFGVVEKALRMRLENDDIDSMPIMPSMVGGSFLYSAEDAYNKLVASLLGLVGQRWMDSIDEQILQINLDSMTNEQQEKFTESVITMLRRSKETAEASVKNGRPVLERIRHILPVFNEKQMSTMGNMNGGQSGRAATISIDDIMLHARMFAGAVGVDLSMLGFADQLSGGLGDGGFFRTSAQVAERSRVTRNALTGWGNHIIDIHTMRRYGVVFDAGDRPWRINYAGAIGAFESEKQRTRMDAMNAAAMVAQTIQMLKDQGASVEIMETFLTKQMLMDEDEAKLYAQVVNAKPTEGDGGM